MKFNIYYGVGENFSQQQLINSFDTIEGAEEYLLKYIKSNHPDAGYVRKTFISKTKRQYDYGDHTHFYTIVKSIEVVAAVIIANKKVFATQRGYGEFKGKWEFPGGKIEQGETNEEALIREIREELNVEIKVSNLIQTINYDYPDFHIVMYCYKSFIGAGEPKLLEHEAACWVTKDEIDKLEWLPADLKIVKTVKKLLD